MTIKQELENYNNNPENFIDMDCTICRHYIYIEQTEHYFCTGGYTGNDLKPKKIGYFGSICYEPIIICERSNVLFKYGDNCRVDNNGCDCIQKDCEHFEKGKTFYF